MIFHYKVVAIFLMALILIQGMIHTMKIKVLITGCTIDKAYKELTGELSFTETHMVDMLNRGRSMADTLSEVLFLKDSLEMTDSDRAFILDKCQIGRASCRERV